MQRSMFSSRRVGAAVAGVALVWALLPIQAAHATVTAVQGEAFGYTSSISLFGGPAGIRGVGQYVCTSEIPPPALPPGCVPAAQFATAASPIVTLPSTGGNLSQTDPDGFLAQYGPARFFSAASATVSTEGTTGAGGSVTSTATLNSINVSGDEVLTATSGSSTCTASETTRSASTTITNGVLTIDEDAGGNPINVSIPINPPVNYTVDGVIPGVGDSFQYIFNEQIISSDGTITVYAGHLRALGPTAIGDLYWGKSLCGVTETTPAVCTVTGRGIDPVTGRKFIQVTAQDASGLASIAVTTAFNILTPVTTSPSPWTVGTSSPVVITAYKDNPAMVSRVAYVITDSDGNQSSCI